jgi:hypothetical protein
LSVRYLGLPAGLLVLVAGLVLLVGCGGSEPRSTGSSLSSYLAEVEPIRLGVNRLLDGADPILDAYRDHRIGPNAAWRRMNALEERFAGYAVRIADVRHVPMALREEQRRYTHTFVFEDAYLSALAAALPDRDFGDLPNTQNRQRRAIIAWRIAIESLAAREGTKLPAALTAAGRGEIAPSPTGS